jgi:hypothetical protein
VMEVTRVPMTSAERARRYRRRKRVAAGTDGVIMVGPGNQNSRRHGVYSADLELAVRERLAALPTYLQAEAFADATAIVFRRVERAQRLGEWVQGLSEEEAVTPRKAGSSSPEEISRHADDSALRGLSVLGLVPASAARFAAKLEQAQKPDLAQLAAQARLEGWVAGHEGSGAG